MLNWLGSFTQDDNVSIRRCVRRFPTLVSIGVVADELKLSIPMVTVALAG
jgi:hypothetical protein